MHGLDAIPIVSGIAAVSEDYRARCKHNTTKLGNIL